MSSCMRIGGVLLTACTKPAISTEVLPHPATPVTTQEFRLAMSNIAAVCVASNDSLVLTLL